eukprot:12853316-Ditylum_brightwellii.AAC.1
MSYETAHKLFHDIQQPDIKDHQIKKLNQSDFLGAMYFLKNYQTKKSQAGFIGCSTKYGLSKAWKYVYAIQNGLISKIPDSKQAIADEGYVDALTKTAIQNEFDSEEVKVLKQRARSASQESINQNLKPF